MFLKDLLTLSPKRAKIRGFINDRYWDQWQCAFMNLLTSKSAEWKAPRQDFLVLDSILYSAFISHQGHAIKSPVTDFSEANSF